MSLQQLWRHCLSTRQCWKRAINKWAIPEAFRLETLELAIAPTGPGAGRTHRRPWSGHWVQVAKVVDQAAFYAYLFQQLTQAAG